MSLIQKLKISWEWDEWLESRASRRRTAKKIGPSVVRRKRSSADKRLLKQFNGERGPSFGIN